MRESPGPGVETEPSFEFDPEPNPFDAPYDDRSPLTRISDWAIERWRSRGATAPQSVLASAPAVLFGSVVLTSLGFALSFAPSFERWWDFAIVGAFFSPWQLLLAAWALTFAGINGSLRRVIRILCLWPFALAAFFLATTTYSLAHNDVGRTGSKWVWAAWFELLAWMVVCVACLLATRPPQRDESADRLDAVRISNIAERSHENVLRDR